jgi:DNA-binding CsgD family transcriptional regulator
MQELICLNDLYRQYTLGNLDKKKFEGLIFKSVMDNYEKFHLYDWDKDECIDYLCWLYPRLSRAIDNYRETGASFENYIYAMIRWSAKEYRFRLADHFTTEYAAWMLHVEDMQVREIEPEYDEENSGTKQIPPSNPRQLLILLLKCYYFVSDDFLDRIVPLLGMEKEQLCQMIEKLRIMRVKREDEIFYLRERIYCQFYRCITFEKRLNAVEESSAHYAKMQSRIKRARERLETMRNRLSRIRLEPTNRQIAEILGISKNSVDSHFHALKNRYRDTEVDSDVCLN